MFLSTPHTKAQREAYRVHIWESAPPYTGGMGLCVIAPVVPYDRPDLSRAPRPIFSLSDLVFSGQSRYFARQPEVTDGFSWQSASACRSSLHATCSADYVHARRSGEPPRTLIRAGPRRHMPCFFCLSLTYTRSRFLKYEERQRKKTKGKNEKQGLVTYTLSRVGDIRSRVLEEEEQATAIWKGRARVKIPGQKILISSHPPATETTSYVLVSTILNARLPPDAVPENQINSPRLNRTGGVLFSPRSRTLRGSLGRFYFILVCCFIVLFLSSLAPIAAPRIYSEFSRKARSHSAFSLCHLISSHLLENKCPTYL